LGTTNLEQIAGTGSLGSGDFGPFLSAILNKATITFKQETVLNGRHLLEYSYDVPRSASRYEVFYANGKGSVFTAYSGKLLLDPQDADLVSLTVRTAELPPEAGKCQAVSEVDYTRILIHQSPALIPKETRLRVIGRQGEENFNVTSYANCHEYGSKSVLHFEPVEISDSKKAMSAPAPAQNPVPPGLHFDFRIVTPIDSDTAAGGDPLDAVLRSPIRDKSGKVLAPTGTHLRGRLLQVEHRSSPEALMRIAVQFDSLDLEGTAVPLNVEVNGQTALHYRGSLVYGYTMPVVGNFIYFGDRLKLDHLDAMGMTVAPPAPQKAKTEEAQPAATPAPSDKQ
jgi:hypothetical protein